MASKTTAVDVGGHSIKAIEVKAGRQGVSVSGFGAVPAADGAGGLASLGLNLKGVVSGLAGREMTLRYNRVPPTPDAQLQKLMDLEIQDLSEQSGGGLSADYNLLPGANEGGEGDDIVLLALAKNEALDERGALVKAAGGSVEGYVPNCIALYNAYLRCGPVDEDSLVCLANIGQDTIDIAIVKGLDLLFARNLTGGGRVLDEAIAKGFNVGDRKAESLKRDLLDLDPASRGRYASSQAEKVTVAAGGAASVVASAIQSSVAFCQSQTGVQGLALDKILVAGGSARLRGLCGMLREAVRCPVELFDPFDNCDLSGLSDAESEDLKTYRYEAVVALGLALGRQDDSLYALEILPESVRKRRRFAQQTIFNIAAGVLGVAVLGMIMRNADEHRTNDQLEANKIRQMLGSQQSIDRSARKLIAENTMRRGVVEFLAQRSVPLDGTLRAMRALRDTAPSGLWLDKLSVVPPTRASSNPRRPRNGRNAKPEGPVVKIEGRVKALGGIEEQAAYSKFSQDFRAHPLIEGQSVEVQTPPAQRSDEQPFVFEVSFPTEHAAVEAEEGGN